MARVKRTSRITQPQFYIPQQPPPLPSSSESSPASNSSSTDHGQSSQEVQENEVQENQEETDSQEEPEEEESEDNSVEVKRPLKDIIQDSREVTGMAKKLKKELFEDHDQIGGDPDQLQPGPVSSDETVQGEYHEPGEYEEHDGDGGEYEGDKGHDEDGEDQEGEDENELKEEEEKHPGDIFLQSIRGSSDRQFEFLNTMIEYRSEYLIYPFESKVAIDDFIKNWIKVDIPKPNFEMLMEQFQEAYLEEIDDSKIDHLGPVGQKVLEMVRKIFVTDNNGIEDIAKRFLKRLTNDVKDQITLLTKIIHYLPMNPTVMPPGNGIPPIDDLIKNWLKVEVPKSELEKAILALRRKYIDTGSKGEKITDLGKEVQNAIQLAEKIWGPVFGTHNTNDEDGRKRSTAPKG